MYLYRAESRVLGLASCHHGKHTDRMSKLLAEHRECEPRLEIRVTESVGIAEEIVSNFHGNSEASSQNSGEANNPRGRFSYPSGSHWRENWRYGTGIPGKVYDASRLRATVECRLFHPLHELWNMIRSFYKLDPIRGRVEWREKRPSASARISMKIL